MRVFLSADEDELHGGDFKTAFNNSAVGNGPYVLTGHERGKSITLERRKDYWREKPHIERIVFKIIADPAVAWSAMRRGDIDEMRVKTDLWAREKNVPGIRFLDAWLLQYNCIAWNVRDPALRDPRVRLALAKAFDTKTIIESLYHGQARPISGPFTPVSGRTTPPCRRWRTTSRGHARF